MRRSLQSWDASKQKPKTPKGPHRAWTFSICLPSNQWRGIHGFITTELDRKRQIREAPSSPRSNRKQESGYHQPEIAIKAFLTYCERNRNYCSYCMTLSQKWGRPYREIQKACCVCKQRIWSRCQRDPWALTLTAAVPTNTTIWDQPTCSSQNGERNQMCVFAAIQP